jgi:uncharacterized damage-inducible protein DinB
MVSNIRMIALRDLRDVRKEIETYPDDASLWRAAPGITNPGGNLALHLAGNMQHYIGVVLGSSSYVRNRSAEFSQRNLTRQQVLDRLDEAISEVDEALGRLTDDDLNRPFPEHVGDMRLLTSQFLIHCLAHMGYHLGQLDYHRRMVTGINRTISAQAIPALDSIPD